MVEYDLLNKSDHEPNSIILLIFEIQSVEVERKKLMPFVKKICKFLDKTGKEIYIKIEKTYIIYLIQGTERKIEQIK